jgi:hypothetical protein
VALLAQLFVTNFERISCFSQSSTCYRFNRTNNKIWKLYIKKPVFILLLILRRKVWNVNCTSAESMYDVEIGKSPYANYVMKSLFGRSVQYFTRLQCEKICKCCSITRYISVMDLRLSQQWLWIFAASGETQPTMRHYIPKDRTLHVLVVNLPTNMRSDGLMAVTLSYRCDAV